MLDPYSRPPRLYRPRLHLRYFFPALGLALALLVAAGGLLLIPAHTNSPLAGPAYRAASLPPGFKMELYASGLPVPRFLSFSPDGVLYVANMGSGRVAALPDRNHDGQPDSVIAVAGGFSSPNNVAFHNGGVYTG